MRWPKPRWQVAASRERLALAEAFGLGQPAVELVHQMGEAAEPRALLLVGGGVERGDGFLDGGEGALAGGECCDAAALPWRELGADLVLLDHGGQRLVERGGGADEGRDGAVAVLACRSEQRAAGGEAAEAGDQAVEDGRLGIGEVEELDGHADAVGGDGEAELVQRRLVELGAVAGEGGLVDGVERDVVDGGIGVLAGSGVGSGHRGLRSWRAWRAGVAGGPRRIGRRRRRCARRGGQRAGGRAAGLADGAVCCWGYGGATGEPRGSRGLGA